jgi:predicted MPP superfamily phosphohydrolase
MKTVVIISDLHCGSVFGLTPPAHFSDHHIKHMRESWNEYCEIARKWLQPDVLIINGDAIEGNQSKQGGVELVTADRNVQCKMAEKCIDVWKAKQIYMTYGTAYHVGDKAEDFEFNIADSLEAKIEGRLYLDVEGVVFDVRHKIGSSGVFHGRATAVLREMMWDLIEQAKEVGPKVDVIVRSHAHYHIWVETPDQIAFITPGLQLKRGRYGSRECSGEIHWGAIRLTVDKGEVVCKEKIIVKLAANKAKVFKVE